MWVLSQGFVCYLVCNCTVLFPKFLSASALSGEQVGHRDGDSRTGVAIKSGFVEPWYFLAVRP